MAHWEDVASVASSMRVTATHHLFNRFLRVGSLFSRYLFLAAIPPTLPVVNEDLTESVTAVLRRGMKQQESCFLACVYGQHFWQVSLKLLLLQKGFYGY